MNVYTEQELPEKERQVKAQLEREIQKTCGCKKIGALLDSGAWILCDYHKGKVQAKK